MASAGATVRPCPEAMVNLFHRRWCVPVIAEVHGAAESRDSTGARFIGLMHRLSVGRSVLRDTVEFATAHGWMRRNPGYGHPLRPELVLTARGARVGPACASLWGLLRRRGLEEVGLRKWTLPAVWTVGDGGGAIRRDPRRAAGHHRSCPRGRTALGDRSRPALSTRRGRHAPRCRLHPHTAGARGARGRRSNHRVAVAATTGGGSAARAATGHGPPSTGAEHTAAHGGGS